jgi:hypothetical protein
MDQRHADSSGVVASKADCKSVAKSSNSTHPPTKQSKQSEQIKQSKHSKHSKHSNQSNQSKQIGGGSTAVATITHSCVPMKIARSGV